MSENIDHKDHQESHHSDPVVKSSKKSRKFNLSSDKKRLILLALVVLAIPLTVGLALVSQEMRSRADEISATKAIYLDGSSWVRFPDGSRKLDSTKDFTIEMWVKPEHQLVNPPIIVREYADPKILTPIYNIILGYISNPVGYLYAVLVGNLNARVNAPEGWVHIALVKSEENEGIRGFVNGQPKFYVVGGSGVAQDSVETILGRALKNDNGLWFKGIIDEVRVSQAAIDIGANWTNGDYQRPLTTNSDTVSLWHFENNLEDSSGNGANGIGEGNIIYVDSFIPVVSSTPIAVDQFRRVFVTSSSYNGALGGIKGADKKCQDSANAANLGGTWNAWVSNTNNRLTHSAYPYKLIDKTIVADNWSDLMDKSLKSPINLTEFGQVKNSFVWTGTDYSGNIASVSCSNWNSTSNLIYGYYGDSSVTDQNWILKNSTTCEKAYALYCFEESTSAESFVVPSPALVTPIPNYDPTPTSIYTPTPVLTESPTLTPTPVVQRKCNEACISDSDCGTSADGSRLYCLASTGSTQRRCLLPNTFSCENPTPTLAPVTPTPGSTVKTLNLNAEADSFVRSSAPATNFGTINNLQNDLSPDEISYLRFNLSALAGKTIKSAKLYLTAGDPTNSSLTLRRATDKSWGEKTITYSNKPGFDSTITTFTAKTLNSKVTLSVTNVVNLKKGGKITFGIKSASDDQGAFYSREYTNSSYRPQLVVEYQ